MRLTYTRPKGAYVAMKGPGFDLYYAGRHSWSVRIWRSLQAGHKLAFNVHEEASGGFYSLLVEVR